MVVVDLCLATLLFGVCNTYTYILCPQVLDEREERDAIAREEKAAAVAAAAAAATISGDAGAGDEGGGGGRRGRGEGGGGGGGGGPRGVTTTPASRRSRGTRTKGGRPLAKASGERTEGNEDGSQETRSFCCACVVCMHAYACRSVDRALSASSHGDRLFYETEPPPKVGALSFKGMSESPALFN